MASTDQRKLSFIDLFSGCGGLSLGLSQAGWEGVFTIEKAGDAFATFKANFLDGPRPYRFRWPEWLEQRVYTVEEALRSHRFQLAQLSGSIDVIAGGPPCQGFSFNGLRRAADPRNRLFKKYVEFVSTVVPQAVILENVPGMGVVHGASKRRRRSIPGPVPTSFYEKLVKMLDGIGYAAEGMVLDASAFGVPQKRPRLVVIGLRKDIAARLPRGVVEVFANIEACRVQQLADLGLAGQVSAADAISDLETLGKPLVQWMDSATRGVFFAPDYSGPITRYQELMHANTGAESMDSLRLANHTQKVRDRFARIHVQCRKGTSLNDKDRVRLGISKHRTFVMAPDQPAPTVTTLPDDVLHYREPRILSVRESARLQSFPDWFQFRGKYTTGGEKRRFDCPRYTQVGNAVPPLLARAIGLGVQRALTLVSTQGFQSTADDCARLGARSVVGAA